MQLPGNSNPQIKEYIDALHQTERMVVKFADKNLATSEVSVDIEDPYSLDTRLPGVFWEKFYDIGKPTEAATGLSLGLRYDRVQKYFMPSHASIHFDNGCSAEFKQAKGMRESGLFYFQVTDENHEAIPDSREKQPSYLFDTGELRSILELFNVTLPDHEQPAEWSEIVVGMLAFCRFWSVHTEKTVPISPLVDVRAEDQIRSSMPELVDNPMEAFGKLFQRHVTLSIDTTRDRVLRSNASSSLQLTLESDGLNEEPTYNDLSRVPIYYKPEDLGPVLPEFIEHPHLVRIEKNHKRKSVVPKLPILRAIQRDITLAETGAVKKLD